jgi:hypothetical protein
MYDGGHTETDHYKALAHYFLCLDDVFIFIVDDWNWTRVRDGTYNAIRDTNLQIMHKHEIFTSDNNTHPPIGHPRQRLWHNGVVVFVLQKKSTN